MSLWKSKTFWSGLAAVVTGIGIGIGGDIPTGVQTVIGGLGLIFLRQAVGNTK